MCPTAGCAPLSVLQKLRAAGTLSRGFEQVFAQLSQACCHCGRISSLLLGDRYLSCLQEAPHEIGLGLSLMAHFCSSRHVHRAAPLCSTCSAAHTLLSALRFLSAIRSANQWRNAHA